MDNAKEEQVKTFLKSLGDKDEEVRAAVLEVAKQNAKRFVCYLILFL